MNSFFRRFVLCCGWCVLLVCVATGLCSEGVPCPIIAFCDHGTNVVQHIEAATGSSQASLTLPFPCEAVHQGAFNSSTVYVTSLASDSSNKVAAIDVNIWEVRWTATLPVAPLWPRESVDFQRLYVILNDAADPRRIYVLNNNDGSFLKQVEVNAPPGQTPPRDLRFHPTGQEYWVSLVFSIQIFSYPDDIPGAVVGGVDGCDAMQFTGDASAVYVQNGCGCCGFMQRIRTSDNSITGSWPFNGMAIGLVAERNGVRIWGNHMGHCGGGGNQLFRVLTPSTSTIEQVPATGQGCGSTTTFALSEDESALYFGQSQDPARVEVWDPTALTLTSTIPLAATTIHGFAFAVKLPVGPPSVSASVDPDDVAQAFTSSVTFTDCHACAGTSPYYWATIGNGNCVFTTTTSATGAVLTLTMPYSSLSSCGFEEKMQGGFITYTGYLSVAAEEYEGGPACVREGWIVEMQFYNETTSGQAALVLVGSIVATGTYKSTLARCVDATCAETTTDSQHNQYTPYVFQVSLEEGINHDLSLSRAWLSSSADANAAAGTATIIQVSSARMLTPVGGRSYKMEVSFECKLLCSQVQYLHVVSGVAVPAPQGLQLRSSSVAKQSVASTSVRISGTGQGTQASSAAAAQGSPVSVGAIVGASAAGVVASSAAVVLFLRRRQRVLRAKASPSTRE